MMFELTQALAQNIVDRAMAILPYNVNVMDNQGLILGSGEKSRVNTRHEGAQLVLSNRRIVEIDEQSARKLKGVQPGINLPLMHDDELIGVLGISGAPEDLRTYAELVRMTAEMLLDQSRMQAERQWRKQRSDDLLAVLLGESAASQRLIDEANQLGLKPYLGRTPYLIEVGDESRTAPLSQWLEAHYLDSWSIPMSSSSVLWCCPSARQIDPLKLIARVKKQGLEIRRIACGVATEDIHELRRGGHRVTELLAYGQSVKPDHTVLSLEQSSLPSLLWTHRNDEAISELTAPIKLIQSKDSNGQLLKTLACWFEHDGHPQNCSESLGVHRNSLRYRLERITEITGKDVGKFNDLVELYLGIQLLVAKS